MKNLLLTLIILTASISMAFAQPWFKRPVVRQPIFGIVGGLNVAKIMGDDAFDSSDASMGVHAGIVMQYNIMNAIFIQPGLMYSQKGYEQKYTLLGVQTKVTDSYDYIEMPLLFKLNVAAGAIQVQPYIGPAVSLLINAKSTEKTTIGDLTSEHTDGVMDQMRNIDLGLVFGADVILMKRLMIGASYNIGMTNIYEDDALITGSAVQNGVFMLSLGILFNK